jgi:hypothetical protein
MNNWAEFLTAILVLITAFYAYFTFRMMKATEKAVIATNASTNAINRQIEASLRPYIDFELKRYPNNLIYMHIRNSGRIAATNLSLKLDRDFFPLGHHGKKNLKEAFIFSNEVASLSPGTEITVGMLEIGEIGKLEDVSPTRFKIVAKYTWAGHNTPVVEDNEIDLSVFSGSGLIPKPDLLYEIAAATNNLSNLENRLRNIQKILEEMNNNKMQYPKKLSGNSCFLRKRHGNNHL